MSIYQYVDRVGNQLGLDAHLYLKNLKSKGTFTYKTTVADRALMLDNDKVAQWLAIATVPAVYGNQIDVKLLNQSLPAVGVDTPIYIDRALSGYNTSIYSLVTIPVVPPAPSQGFALTLLKQGRYAVFGNFVTKQANSSVTYKVTIAAEVDQTITAYNSVQAILEGQTAYSVTNFYNVLTTTADNRVLTIDYQATPNELLFDRTESYLTLFYLTA